MLDCKIRCAFGRHGLRWRKPTMLLSRINIAVGVTLQFAIAFVANSALAATCPMTSAQFEAAVPHIEVEECPKHALGRQVFCRASAGGDFVHVFFFDMKGEQCLLKLQSYDEDAFELEIKDE